MTNAERMEVTMTQSQEEWLKARANRFTASVVHKLMGSSRSGSPLSKTAETFVYERAAEILTGNSKPVYGDALDWGIAHEQYAFFNFNQQNFQE